MTANRASRRRGPRGPEPTFRDMDAIREDHELATTPPYKLRSVTRGRVIGLLLAVGLLLALAYPGLSKAAPLSVPSGAHAGQLTGLRSCTFPTESGRLSADCGTLVVPEDRANPRSRLIALPVVRIRAQTAHPLAPVFHLNGGPGLTDMEFPGAGRLAGQHDIVLVGFRGVDGSSVLS